MQGKKAVAGLRASQEVIGSDRAQGASDVEVLLAKVSQRERERELSVRTDVCRSRPAAQGRGKRSMLLRISITGRPYQ